MDELFDEQLPVLPYNGTSGWSGSETSRQRADLQDKNGVTNKRQRLVVEMLRGSGSHGLTWKELSLHMGLHHGAISGVLSVLHKRNVIVRLTHTRHRCAVYVLPEYVNEREQASYRPNASARLLTEVLNDIDSDLVAWDVPTARARIASILEAFHNQG